MRSTRLRVLKPISFSVGQKVSRCSNAFDPIEGTETIRVKRCFTKGGIVPMRSTRLRVLKRLASIDGARRSWSSNAFDPIEGTETQLRRGAFCQAKSSNAFDPIEGTETVGWSSVRTDGLDCSNAFDPIEGTETFDRGPRKHWRNNVPMRSTRLRVLKRRNSWRTSQIFHRFQCVRPD